ncbi:hypothetical protein ACFQ3N_08245 [Virgibacillus byunsanensis]|uniref:DUF2140 family protein n=1 Tax=Virgibacillus byunsanensis TaxID=570945 RepID=A0ABW3LJV4_9BACI
MKKYLNLNTVYIIAAIIAVGFLFVPRVIEIVNLRVQGISYVANDVENYHNNAHPIEGVYTIEIDLNQLENNEGKVLYDGDKETQIYVSKVIIHNEEDLEVSFRSKGNYSLGGATLVSGVKHESSKNGFTKSFQAESKATYKGDTYKLSPSGSSGLNYHNGDEFGFYFTFPDEIDLEEESRVDVTVTNLYLNLWAKKR